MKFRKQPVVIEAITFDEFIQYGRDNGANIVDGMPWAFSYNGHPVSHENDECYLIPTLEGTHNFTPKDVLITGVRGEIYPCKVDIFKETYAPAEAPVATTVTMQGILDKIKGATYTLLPNGRTTVCQLTLQNGFTVEGQSACVSAAAYNQALGEKYAYEEAVANVWKFEGYLLAERLFTL